MTDDALGRILSRTSADLNLDGVTLADAHCHLQLSPTYERAAQIIDRAKRDSHVVFASVCGTSPGEDWGRIEVLTGEHHSFVVPSFGLHPWWLRRFFDSYPGANPLLHQPNAALQGRAPDHCIACAAGTPDQGLSLSLSLSSGDARIANTPAPFDAYSTLERLLRSALQSHPQAGVGECGLDKNIREDVSLQVQEAALRCHMLVANDLRRPLILHCVGEWGRLLAVLAAAESEFPHIPAVVLHSANSLHAEMVPAFARLSRVYFSFTYIGSASLSNTSAETRRLRNVNSVRAVPLERLLLETDSPDQLPFPLREAGLECNEIAVIRLTCHDMAEILGMPARELANVTTRNARRALTVTTTTTTTVTTDP